MSHQRGGVSLYGATTTPDQQRRAFTSGEVSVAVYGLGKMGLPLAAAFAEASGNVIGVDIDSTVVDTVNCYGCPVTREPIRRTGTFGSPSRAR